MPQISPINWLIISVSSCILIITFITINEQSKINSPQNIQINNNTLNWNW